MNAEGQHLPPRATDHTTLEMDLMPRVLCSLAIAVVGALTLTITPVNAQRSSQMFRSSTSRERARDLEHGLRERADLIVQRIREDRNDIRVRIHNLGDARSSESRLAVIVVTPTGRRFLTAEIPPLRPHEDHTIRLRTIFRPDFRGTEIIAIADFFNEIQESNERNNTLTRLVQ